MNIGLHLILCKTFRKKQTREGTVHCYAAYFVKSFRRTCYSSPNILYKILYDEDFKFMFSELNV